MPLYMLVLALLEGQPRHVKDPLRWVPDQVERALGSDGVTGERVMRELREMRERKQRERWEETWESL